MVNKLFTCHCIEIFRSLSKYKYHVKRVHQNMVTVKFSENIVKVISRDTDGKFKCFCDGVFLLPRSICDHAKSCSSDDDRTVVDMTESMELSENMMDRNDGEDIVAERAINNLPIDCIGNSVCKHSY